MRLSKCFGAVCVLSIPSLASVARAADPPATAAAAGSFQLGGPSSASAQTSMSGASSGEGFWDHYRPLPMALELGVYAGVGFFADQHNLQNIELVANNPYGHQRLAPALDLGLRAGFYPLSFLGVEGELGVLPTKTRTDGIKATVWTYRAHLVAQYPGYRLVPFVVFGLGSWASAARRAVSTPIVSRISCACRARCLPESAYATS